MRNTSCRPLLAKNRTIRLETSGGAARLIHSTPTKTVYIVGDKLNLTGMVVTATYSDGNKKEVTGYTTDPAAGEVLGTGSEQIVTISYTIYKRCFWQASEQ